MTIETELEDDGRWLSEVMEIPGVMAYGQTREEAVKRAQALALRVIADRLEHGEPVPEMYQLFSVAVGVIGAARKRGWFWLHCCGRAGA